MCARIDITADKCICDLLTAVTIKRIILTDRTAFKPADAIVIGLNVEPGSIPSVIQ